MGLLQQRPSEGRIVHYVLAQYDGVHTASVGQKRAAVITRVWGDEMVQLTVFLDASNDMSHLDASNARSFFLAKSSCHLGDTPGTWHWPEYVPAIGEEPVVPTNPS